MNEQTTILLQKLSESLGTTSEYLWAVLIKQAPISATISMVIFTQYETLSKGINWLWEKAKEDRPDADCFKEEREEG